MLPSAIPVPDNIPAPVAAVAPYFVIALLVSQLGVANKKLEKTSKALNAVKRNVEEEKTASRTARRTAENARRHQEEAERAAAEAAEALQRAEEARLATERRWLAGVRPECRPSQEDIDRMKARYHYSSGFLHLAVVGSSGSGKSSFINAVRGLSNNDPIAAPTGTVETTATVTRYTDPRPTSPSRILWYDFPGAGTQNVPDWQYFNNLGLYIFDCIILLIDIRFLDSDLAILRACEQFTNIKVFIARSKSDQHINNLALDGMSRGFDPFQADDEARVRFQQIRTETRGRFIDETYQNVQTNLERNNISPKRTYIVCKDALHAIWNNSPSPMGIDEEQLRNDVAECVRRRLQ